MAVTSQKPSVMSAVLKKKKPVVFGSLAPKALDPANPITPNTTDVTQALKPQRKAALLPAQVPSKAPKSVMPAESAVTKPVTPVALNPTVKPQPAVEDKPNIYNQNPNVPATTISGQPATSEMQAQMQALLSQRKLAQESGTDLPPDKLKVLQDMQSMLAGGKPGEGFDLAKVQAGATGTPGTLATGDRYNQNPNVITQATTTEQTDRVGTAITPTAASPEMQAQIEALIGKQKIAQQSGTDLSDVEKALLQRLQEQSSQATPILKTTTEQTATSAPQPTSGPPGSAIPSGETDANIQQPGQPAQTPAPTFDGATAWAGRMQNPGLKIKVGGRMIDDPAGAQKIQSLIDYDNQFLAGLPPEAQGWASERLASEQKTFEAALAQYPDQWEKIFRDHQTRVADIQNDWNSSGQYEKQLQDLTAKAPPELKVKIEELPSIQQNELYRNAIEQYGQNPSPEQLAAKYAEMYPNGYDFSLQPPGFDPSKGTLEEYQKQFGYEPTKSDATIGKTDTSGINTSGQTQVGTEVTQQQRDELTKELNAQGYTPEEINSILSGQFQELEASKQAAIKSAVSQGAMTGFGKTLASIVNATAGVAAGYDRQAAMLKGDLTKQGLDQAAARRAAGLQGLSDIATREAGIAGTQANAGLGAAEIGSRENIAQGELQLAKDTLYQGGQLSALGMKIDENLKAYGLSLEKYQTDQNFDIALMENDLKERIAQQTGDITAAELEAKNITASIQAGMEERRIDDARSSEIASLEQRAATGDTEAQFRTTQLKVETELRKLQLDNDWSQFVGQVLYNIMSGREQLDQRRAEFLESIRQYEESKGGGGFGSILGSIAGTLGGSLLGPVGTIVGTWAGNQITGGGKQPKVQK